MSAENGGCAPQSVFICGLHVVWVKSLSGNALKSLVRFAFRFRLGYT